MKLLLKKYISLLIVTLVISSGCSDNQNLGDNPVAVAINEFKMTTSEFQSQCKQDLEYNSDYKTSIEKKTFILESIIEKELLIQEAKRIGLDRNKKFTSAIERYWEATLIKQLMEEKSKEISQTIMVSDADIKKRYIEYKQSNKELPELHEIEKKIAEEILHTKKTKALKNWITTLKENADITINESIFEE